MQAVRAAAQKAESVSSALLAWGYGPDSNDPERRAADLELAARVGKSPTLMEVARYLGRLKELMDGKRKNGYAYGRGEKYSLELGGDIKIVKFVRYEKGEGLEKRVDDFASEVAGMVK